MDQQLNPVSRSMDIIRHLNNLAIGGSEEFMAWQFKHAQTLISHGSKHLKASQADATKLGMSNAMEMAQECVNATMDYQMGTMSLVQKQASQVQALFSHLLANSLAAPDVMEQFAKTGRVLKLTS